MFQLLLTSVKRKEKLNPAIRSEGIKWAKQVERPFLLLFCLKSLKRKGFQQNWPKIGFSVIPHILKKLGIFQRTESFSEGFFAIYSDIY